MKGATSSSKDRMNLSCLLCSCFRRCKLEEERKKENLAEEDEFGVSFFPLEFAI